MVNFAEKQFDCSPGSMSLSKLLCIILRFGARVIFLGFVADVKVVCASS